MTESELLCLVRELESHLFSRDLDRWAKAQPDGHREQIRSLRTKVYSLRSQLETNRLSHLADEMAESAPQLEQGLKDLRKKIYDMARLRDIDDLVDRVTGVVFGMVT
jgi:hypothetical protein